MVYEIFKCSTGDVMYFWVALGAVFTFGSKAHADEGLGDVYVNATNGGGLIFLDGNTTGIMAPGVVRGVSPGTHSIRVDDGCKTGVADVTVRVNAIERANVTLELGSGSVRVESTPPEAKVSEAGKELGTGSFGPFPLTCGTHVLVGTATGRQSVTYTVEVPLRGHVDVRLDLPQAALGSIAITPTPFEAEVLVDGVSHGTGPMTVDALPAGPHVVSARLDGYLPAEQPVTVVAYQIVRSSITLLPKPPPVPLKSRLGLDRVDWPRVGVNTAVSAAAIGVGVVSWLQYQRAVEGYDSYSELTYADGPEAFYAENVEGPRTLAWVLAGTSGAVAIGSGFLWATTHPRPALGSAPPPAPATPSIQVAPTPSGVRISGQF